MQAVCRIAAGEIATLQPTEAATARFNRAFRRATEGTVWLTGCRNWYLDRNGVPDVWPWTIARFRAELRRPDLADYEVTPGDAVAAVPNVGVAASWPSRIVQVVMRRFIAPQLNLAHGVAPFRRTLGLLAAVPPCPPPRGFARRPAMLGGVPGEWLRRRDRQAADAPILLHFHGGGFVAGTSRLGRRIVAR